MYRTLVVAAYSLLNVGVAVAAQQAAAGAGPRTDDVPPFLHARGGLENPLTIAISGLATGYARVAAGTRVFALCWEGGDTPFEVVLTGPGRATLGPVEIHRE